MFTVALFTITRTWKLPKCLSTEEQIKKLYIYTTEYNSVIKRNKTGSFIVMCMNLESVIQSEARKRKTNIAYLCIYMESRETALMNLLAGQGQRCRRRKGLVHTQGEGGGGID